MICASRDAQGEMKSLTLCDPFVRGVRPGLCDTLTIAKRTALDAYELETRLALIALIVK